MPNKISFRNIQNITLAAFYGLYIFDLCFFLFSTLRLLIHESKNLEQLGDFLIFDFFRITIFVVVFNGVLLYFLSKRFRIAYILVLGLNTIAIIYPIHRHPNFVSLNIITNSLEILFLLINWNNFSIIRHSLARWKRALIYIGISSILIAGYIFAGFNLLTHSVALKPDIIAILKNYWDNLLSTSQVEFDESVVSSTNTIGRIFLSSITYVVWALLLPVLAILFDRKSIPINQLIHYDAKQADYNDLMNQSQDNLAAFRLQPVLSPVPVEHGNVYAAATDDCLIGLGNPCISEPNSQTALNTALESYEKYAQSISKVPALFQVDSRTAEAAKSLGWHIRQMGIEGLVDTDSFDLSKPSYKKIRNSYTNFRKARWRIRVIELDSLQDEDKQAVEYLKNLWLDSKFREDLGFTMNLWPLNDQIKGYLATAWHEVYGYCGAFTFLEFVHENQRSASLDLFYTNHFIKNSLSEGLLIEAILKLKEKGVRFVSLGLVPNMTLNNKPHRFTRVTAAVFGGLTGYDSKSLFLFKKKFATQWLDKYIDIRGIDTLPLALRDVSRLMKKGDK